MIAVLLDLLFPPRCAFCGKLMEHAGSGVCPDCEQTLPYIDGSGAVRDIGGFACATTFYYDGMVKTGVRALKFRKTSWRAEIFGRYIAQTAAELLGGQFDAVTFVPVSTMRNFSRGFDQARLLARSAAKIWKVPAEPTLRKARHNRAQSSLNNPQERRENVKNVYRPVPGARIAGRRFLLIDDVVTTGSTLSACAEVLVMAGARSVVCASLAGGHRQKQPRQGAWEETGCAGRQI